MKGNKIYDLFLRCGFENIILIAEFIRQQNRTKWL